MDDKMITDSTGEESLPIGDLAQEIKFIDTHDKAQRLQKYRRREEDQESLKYQKLVSPYQWANVDDDDDLRQKLDVQMANPWKALDPDAFLPQSYKVTNSANDNRRQPLMPFAEIPNPIKTTTFWVLLKKPNRSVRRGAEHSYLLVNKGPRGSKNCHTSLMIDGGQFGCPVIRFQMQLSRDPSNMMANGLFRAFGDDQFHFDSGYAPRHPKQLTDEGFAILKRGNSSRDEVLKRLHGCIWTIGGGVVLEGFDTDTVRKIKAHPELYHPEVKGNIEAIEQLGTLGGRISLSFSLGSSKEEELYRAHDVLRCFQHSVHNGHINHYPYLDANGRFTWDMPHIKKVANGMNVIPRKTEDPKSVETYRVKPVENTYQGLQTYMIAKACADLREVQFEVANRNAVSIEQHRAYIVATSPHQLEGRDSRDGAEIYTVFVTLNYQGRDLTELTPEPAIILSINWENNAKAQFEERKKRWRGPVIQPPETELEGCHFVMFAHAKKDSVIQKAYATLQEAKLAGGLPIHLEYEMQDRLSPRLKTAFRQIFKPEFRQLALMLMGRYDEAVKVPRKMNKILFPVKNDEFVRTPEEEKAYKTWADWVSDHCHENGPTKWALNTEQLIAISTLANTQFAKIIRGPPGTGKSLTGGSAVWAALAAGNGEGRILVVASSNEATDAIASKITHCRLNDSRMKKALVIRMHVEGAEYQYAQEHGTDDSHPLAERRGQESERLQNLKATFQIATLSGFTTEKMRSLSKAAKRAHGRHIATYGLSLAEAIWQESQMSLRQTRLSRRIGESLMNKQP
ncbi:hypothetical protein EPUS_09353 [Endocarpon pusillum Z07020]|uniref:DNA2/NAM7 helicase helicase domain-containing protein n=1 Tax=Endocarpon pusillum (strain Z07020 / HMAS-L-300199) TaxID=1263415 RepID=U1GJ82_ENDPU|nr:uncharacterized protein EPUS_09353 [Endocarpon pusillum Z07020]ERF71901.1 hypothetical protein EPUS_09353 [Endocarpon pusillum Z07020]